MSKQLRPDFEKVFDFLPGIYLILKPNSPSFTILAANKARYEATKTNENQIGKKLFDMFPDDPADPNPTGVANLTHSLDQVIKNKKPDSMAVQKYNIPRPDGRGFEERYWSPINTPVLDEKGEILYIIHEVEDVTEYIMLKEQKHEHIKLTDALKERVKKTEIEVFQRAQEIQKANLQLQLAHEKLALLYKRVKEMDEIKTQLFANVSHELRTPLTLIIGPVAELLKSENLTQAQVEYLLNIQRNGKELLRTVNDLLDVAKIEAGKMEPQFSEFNITKLIRFVASQFESAFETKAIEFKLEAKSDFNIQADSEKVQRIVMNLLSNAFKFTPKKGRIECIVSESKEHLTISIRDNGPGIAKEMRQSIFERFRQLDTGHARSHGGTGLSLSIVKDFVEIHHGTIDIIDTPGGGGDIYY